MLRNNDQYKIIKNIGKFKVLGIRDLTYDFDSNPNKKNQLPINKNI